MYFMMAILSDYNVAPYGRKSIHINLTNQSVVAALTDITGNREWKK